MGDITANDVVVVQTNDDEDYSGQRTNRVTPILQFGNGQLLYPTNGVPLPDKNRFRLKTYVKRVWIQQIPGTYEWVYDSTNYTLRAYARADGTEMSGAIPATVLPLEIEGA